VLIAEMILYKSRLLCASFVFRVGLPLGAELPLILQIITLSLHSLEPFITDGN
jgi:hypothetical protein